MRWRRSRCGRQPIDCSFTASTAGWMYSPALMLGRTIRPRANAPACIAGSQRGRVSALHAGWWEWSMYDDLEWRRRWRGSSERALRSLGGGSGYAKAQGVRCHASESRDGHLIQQRRLCHLRHHDPLVCSERVEAQRSQLRWSVRAALPPSAPPIPTPPRHPSLTCRHPHPPRQPTCHLPPRLGR